MLNVSRTVRSNSKVNLGKWGSFVYYVSHLDYISDLMYSASIVDRVLSRLDFIYIYINYIYIIRFYIYIYIKSKWPKDGSIIKIKLT